jgi:hypothetical protein
MQPLNFSKLNKKDLQLYIGKFITHISTLDTDREQSDLSNDKMKLVLATIGDKISSGDWIDLYNSKVLGLPCENLKEKNKKKTKI